MIARALPASRWLPRREKGRRPCRLQIRMTKRSSVSPVEKPRLRAVAGAVSLLTMSLAAPPALAVGGNGGAGGYNFPVSGGSGSLGTGQNGPFVADGAGDGTGGGGGGANAAGGSGGISAGQTVPQALGGGIRERAWPKWRQRWGRKLRHGLVYGRWRRWWRRRCGWHVSGPSARCHI